jgi:predicted HicB family RNase H-like nuclease
VAVSKKQQASVHKYVKENYDRLELTVIKGKKAAIKEHAESKGESLNAFVNRAIDETVERDNAPGAQEGSQ